MSFGIFRLGRQQLKCRICDVFPERYRSARSKPIVISSIHCKRNGSTGLVKARHWFCDYGCVARMQGFTADLREDGLTNCIRDESGICPRFRFSETEYRDAAAELKGVHRLEAVVERYLRRNKAQLADALMLEKGNGAGGGLKDPVGGWGEWRAVLGARRHHKWLASLPLTERVKVEAVVGDVLLTEELRVEAVQSAGKTMGVGAVKQLEIALQNDVKAGDEEEKCDLLQLKAEDKSWLANHKKEVHMGKIAKVDHHHALTGRWPKEKREVARKRHRKATKKGISAKGAVTNMEYMCGRCLRKFPTQAAKNVHRKKVHAIHRCGMMYGFKGMEKRCDFRSYDLEKVKKNEAAVGYKIGRKYEYFLVF